MLLPAEATDSYYNAETCGRPVNTRRGRESLHSEAPNEVLEPELKVMGGRAAKPGEMPWTVQLVIPVNDQGKEAYSICGGTMISARHLITAAHCFLATENSPCEVEDIMTDREIAKNVDLWIGRSCQPADGGANCPKEHQEERRYIQRVALCHHYGEDKCTKSYFDIALLELDEAVTTPHACLPHLHNMDEFDEAVANMISFGFGIDPLRNVAGSAQFLQVVDLGTAHDRRRYAAVHKLPYDNVLCTRETMTRNVCAGDSGGGVLAKHDGRYFLLGSISYGSACGAPVHDAQVNMDINLFTATIDKYIVKQAPNWRDEWTD